MNILDLVLSAQKSGAARGIPSICTAHPLALEGALRHGLAHGQPVLIEATCNQVNQFGGYTGLNPAEFMRSVGELAERLGFPASQLLLGGDHLGPLPWNAEPAEGAMNKAVELVRAYAAAGFGKIHLDCSTPCADDRELPVERMADRAARLAAAAEEACRSAGLPLPRYVIGTEVPAAGGAKAGEEELTVTSPADAAETIAVTRKAFAELGLEAAWERVIALVVQPGVEFGHDAVHAYQPAAAAGLARFIEGVPGLIYEAHSTDYQPAGALRALVRDHFAILKVGPGLTFAVREAVFALAALEEELCEQPSQVRAALEAAMLADPSHWRKHYLGGEREQRLARAYSFSDRIRYYWPAAPVQAALARLMANLGEAPLPLTLLSQFFPREYEQIRDGELPNHPRALLLGRVLRVLDEYGEACGG